MLQDHMLIFDGAVQGTSPVYTGPQYVEPIGAAAARRLWCVVSDVSGTSPTLTVEFEETASVEDSRYFQADLGTPIINAAALSTSAITVITGYDDGQAPDAAFGRARIQLGGTSPKANIRLYMTSRSADANNFAPGTFVVFNELIFDEFVDGTGTFYSSPSVNSLLASADVIAIRGATFIKSGTSPTLTLQLESSPDNLNWANRAATPELNNIALTVGAYTPTGISLGASPPPSAFMRARMQLGGTAPKGRVKIWITGRGQMRSGATNR